MIIGPASKLVAPGAEPDVLIDSVCGSVSRTRASRAGGSRYIHSADAHAGIHVQRTVRFHCARTPILRSSARVVKVIGSPRDRKFLAESHVERLAMTFMKGPVHRMSSLFPRVPDYRRISAVLAPMISAARTGMSLRVLRSIAAARSGSPASSIRCSTMLTTMSEVATR